MNSVISKFNNMKVISLYFPEDRNLFDLHGRLSSNGRTHFWREMNRFIRKTEVEEKAFQEELLKLFDEQMKLSQANGRGDNKGHSSGISNRPPSHINRGNAYFPPSLEAAYHKPKVALK